MSPRLAAYEARRWKGLKAAATGRTIQARARGADMVRDANRVIRTERLYKLTHRTWAAYLTDSEKAFADRLPKLLKGGAR